MKHKIFNRRLYLEGLRQLRTIGLLGLVIQLGFAIFIPLCNYMEEKEFIEQMRQFSTGYIGSSYDHIQLISAGSSHIYVLLYIFLFVPIMALSLFRFLNSRESSDFYHSIPQSRICLFFSYTTALYTWVITTLTVTCLSSMITYKLCEKYIQISYEYIPPFFLNLFVIAALLIGILLLAQTLCGNMMSVAVVSLIILATPRLMLMIYAALMNDSLSYLTEDILGIFQMNNNLLYALFDFINGENTLLTTTLHFPMFYTLTLALILHALAVLGFHKRRSEAAESAMNSRFLQLCFRSIFVMIICLLPISYLYYLAAAEIFEGGAGINTSMSVTIFYLVIMYLIALLGLFVYELLTSKNVTSALKALKSFPLILVCNAILLVFLLCSRLHYENLTLNKDSIHSIVLQDVLRDTDYYSENDYFNNRLKTCKIKNKEFINFLCDSFQKYKEDYQKRKRLDDSVVYEETVYTYTIQVDFKGSSGHSLYFGFTEEDYQRLKEYLYQSEALVEVFTELPADSKVNYSSSSHELTEAEFADVYNTLCEELNSGEFDIQKWISTLPSSHSYPYWIEFSISTAEGTLHYQGLPITSATPKTYELYQSLYKQHSEQYYSSFQAIMSHLSDRAYIENAEVFYLTLADDSENFSFSFSNSSVANDMDEFIRIIKLLSDSVHSANHYNEATDFSFHLYYNYSNGEDSEDAYIELYIPKDIVNEIRNASASIFE